MSERTTMPNNSENGVLSVAVKTVAKVLSDLLSGTKSSPALGPNFESSCPSPPLALGSDMHDPLRGDAYLPVHRNDDSIDSMSAVKGPWNTTSAAAPR